MAIAGEGGEGDGAVGVKCVRAMLPKQRRIHASIVRGVISENVLALFPKPVICEAIADPACGGSNKLVRDGVEEALQSYTNRDQHHLP